MLEADQKRTVKLNFRYLIIAIEMLLLAWLEKQIALNVSYMEKTDDGAVDTLSLTQFTKVVPLKCKFDTVLEEISLTIENVTTLDDYEEHYFDEEKPSWADNSPSYTDQEVELLLGIGFGDLTFEDSK